MADRSIQPVNASPAWRQRRDTMYDLDAVKEKILELYPDIQKYGIFLSVKKDKMIGGDKYVLTLEKDNRHSSFEIGRQDVRTCMEGQMCGLITAELARFIRQFIDETYAVPEAG
jgi:hypothetical protein